MFAYAIFFVFVLSQANEVEGANANTYTEEEFIQYLQNKDMFTKLDAKLQLNSLQLRKVEKDGCTAVAVVPTFEMSGVESAKGHEYAKNVGTGSSKILVAREMWIYVESLEAKCSAAAGNGIPTMHDDGLFKLLNQRLNAADEVTLINSVKVMDLLKDKTAEAVKAGKPEMVFLSFKIGKPIPYPALVVPEE